MKAIKFLGMLFAAAALSFTTTSCGEDLDMDEIAEEIAQGSIKPSSNIKSNGNELVLTVKIPKFRTEVHTAKFSNGACVSYVEEISCASTKIAEDVFEAIIQSSRNLTAGGLTQSNKNITWDRTKEFSGMSEEQIRAKFEYRKQGAEQLDVVVLFAL